AGPGLRFKLPWPIENVHIVDIQKIHFLPIGYRSSDGQENFFSQSTEAGRDRTMIQDEALMLTGDENILHVELEIQYRIISPADYLFNVREQEEALRDIGEATLRRVIGDYGIDAALTEGKSEIENDILVFSQELANRFGLGVEIQTINMVEAQPPNAVQDAFKDVISAKENKQEQINRARGYENGEIPRAEGEAAKLVNEASGYYQERILTAQGEIQKYSALLKEYRRSEEVTRQRLYLETMEEIFESADFTLIDKNLANILPLLHLSGEGTAKPDINPPSDAMGGREQ
ncbi:MAG: FtsH protease activity modulator HflK, partial [Candidatus Omnitrophica bacterium]|nr:FtsH protease activity modulator HflK [Candidatus Omnitrophota bacterium]